MSLSASPRLFGVAVVLLLLFVTYFEISTAQPLPDAVTWTSCDGPEQCAANVTCPVVATWEIGDCLSDHNVFFCSREGDFVYELFAGNETCGGWTSVAVYNASVCNGEGQTFACEGIPPMKPALPTGLPTIGFHFYADTLSGVCDSQTYDGTYLTTTDSCNDGGSPAGSYSIWLEKNANGTMSLSTWPWSVGHYGCTDAPPSQTITAFPGECIWVPGFVGETGKPVKIALWDPLESTCRHASLSIL